ncbi:MAG: hypothetical protein PHW83_09330, partial [Bacteroidales bacterium]|nr:hypothetical protein [Bacteroidales bacterium]
QVEFDGWTDAIRMGQLLSIPFIFIGFLLLDWGYGLLIFRKYRQSQKAEKQNPVKSDNKLSNKEKK